MSEAPQAFGGEDELMSDLSPEILSVIHRIEKLMRLADKNPSMAEAASAAAKVQELLEAYNLDAATVERASGKTGAREAQKTLLLSIFVYILRVASKSIIRN